MSNPPEKKQRTLKGEVTSTKSLNSPSNSSQGGAKSKPNTSTGRPPTTTVLRSAMYYQNRIIVPDVKTRPYQPNAYSAANAMGTNVNKLPTALMNGPNAMRGIPNSENSNSAIYRTVTDGVSAQATSGLQFSGVSDNIGLNAEMEPRGIDVVITDTEGNKQYKVKKKTIWHRIYRCLQDDRMKGNPNADLILAGSNPQEYRILKKILNIVFLTIGIALLISVIIVIIYTVIADNSD